MKDILMPVVVVYAILLLLIFFISVFVYKYIINKRITYLLWL